MAGLVLCLLPLILSMTWRACIQTAASCVLADVFTAGCVAPGLLYALRSDAECLGRRSAQEVSVVLSFIASQANVKGLYSIGNSTFNDALSYLLALT